jgi:chromosome segregation and condensation protein ScpB
MWSPNLWIPPYSQYQQRIFQVILKSRKQGKTFKDIAYDLNLSGMSSIRGSQFTPPLVHSLLKKGLIRKERLETDVRWKFTPQGMSFLRMK